MKNLYQRTLFGIFLAIIPIIMFGCHGLGGNGSNSQTYRIIITNDDNATKPIPIPDDECESNFYVNNAAGNDINDGTDEDNAWKTIAKINAGTFEPGSCIHLKRNNIWHEELLIPSSGTADKPIIFTAYGDGKKPTLDGFSVNPKSCKMESDHFCWRYSEPASSNATNLLGEVARIYYLDIREPYTPSNSLSNYNIHMLINRSKKTGKTFIMRSLNDNEGLLYRYKNDWSTNVEALKSFDETTFSTGTSPYYEGGRKATIWIRSDETIPGSPNGMQVFLNPGNRTLIDTNNKHNIVIKNISVRGALPPQFSPQKLGWGSAILLHGSQNITIENCEISASLAGISNSLIIRDGEVSNSTNKYGITDSTISNNELHHIQNWAIELWGLSHDNTILENNIHSNWSFGETAGDRHAIAIAGPSENRGESCIKMECPVTIVHGGVTYTFKECLGRSLCSSGNYVGKNQIHDNGLPTRNYYDGLIAIDGAFNTLIEKNWIYNNHQPALLCNLSNTATFSQNIIFNNSLKELDEVSPTGIFLGNAVVDLIRVEKSYNIDIANNTFFNNSISAKSVIPWGINNWALIKTLDRTNNVRVLNNIIANNKVFSTTPYPTVIAYELPKPDNPDSSQFSYNIYYRNRANCLIGDSCPMWRDNVNDEARYSTSIEEWTKGGAHNNSIETNPQFLSTDPKSENFLKLRNNSPAVGAGKNLDSRRSDFPNIGAF